MASLASSSLLLLRSTPSKTSSCISFRSTARAALHLPELPSVGSIEKQLVRVGLNRRSNGPVQQRLLNLRDDVMSMVFDESGRSGAATWTVSEAEQQMYFVLEAVSDRVEMHRNVGEQRDNWNTLLLNSVNMMTLTATALAGLAAGGEAPVAVKVSSALLFTASAGMLLVMNKIQPSQLAEEQRNAVRLFKQIEGEIRSMLAMRAHTEADVEEMTERVLALDRAFPLPLLGAMLEKFPEKFEPATWWPMASNISKATAHQNDRRIKRFPFESRKAENNGWNEELEVEMRAVVDVLKKKDEEDYLRLGSIALKANKVLAVSGPVLTGLAAAASIFASGSSSSWAAAMAAGSLAAAVNTFEHGGQVGMVVEMYRNCAGFFRLVAESIETALEETDPEKRENGELFEMKVALKLGRSLSQLRNLARKSIYSGMEGTEVDEFGSKLF